MSTNTDTTLQPLTVEITHDKMQASLCVEGSGNPGKVTSEEIVHLLHESGVVVDNQVSQRIQQFITLSKGDGALPDRFLIAHKVVRWWMR